MYEGQSGTWGVWPGGRNIKTEAGISSCQERRERPRSRKRTGEVTAGGEFNGVRKEKQKKKV